MNIEEATLGDYRIYAGALEAAAGGYQAAVVVKRNDGEERGTAEVFRDTALSGGRCWAQAEDALAFALLAGKQLVRDEFLRLRC